MKSQIAIINTIDATNFDRNTVTEECEHFIDHLNIAESNRPLLYNIPCAVVHTLNHEIVAGHLALCVAAMRGDEYVIELKLSGADFNLINFAWATLLKDALSLSTKLHTEVAHLLLSSPSRYWSDEHRTISKLAEISGIHRNTLASRVRRFNRGGCDV
ncbi:helix-turn-helix domain-containing protein [Neiella sp. HB171785]|uniref:Helix-turn-helix domain-containing protein n=1 Tax=Neiella litorisoli TaxID=2771431 RepID=A0A8J6UFX3_9GAMM|nr:helix-turn-helix domain-containing protein [Neiella litorisoli]MBD1389266.1 helix-turn-helix domain-containing protein [Neiella litorisoli]